MGIVRAYVTYGNAAAEAWEDVISFDVPTDAEAPQWNAANLPNGEKIELTIFVPLHGRRCTVHVRQGRDPIAQVLCEGSPTITFRTLGGATVSVRIDNDR